MSASYPIPSSSALHSSPTREIDSRSPDCGFPDETPANAIPSPRLKELAAEVTHCIYETIGLVLILDPQIRELTQDRLTLIKHTGHSKRIENSTKKFNVHKWTEKAETLNCDEKQALLDIATRCRMTLVEALAEFNVSENVILNNLVTDADKSSIRFIHHLKLPPKCTPYQKQLFEEAQNTLKGVLFIKTGSFRYFDQLIIKPKSPPEGLHLYGPYVDTEISSRECPNWYEHNFERFKPGYADNLMHVGGELLHSYYGLAIVYPPRSDREQIILRLKPYSMQSMSLSRSFISALLATGSPYAHPMAHERIHFQQRMEARDMLLPKFKELCGEEYYQGIEKTIKLNSERSCWACNYRFVKIT